MAERRILLLLGLFALHGCGARTGLTFEGGDGGRAIDGSTTEDSGPEALRPQARACYYQEGRPPGTDRFVVYAEDAGRDLCVTIQVSTVSTGFDISMPEGWYVMHAAVNPAVNGCPQGCGGWSSPVFSSDGEGTFEFGADMGAYAPCTVGVDLRFYFDSDEAWVPEVVELSANDVQVNNACD